MRRLVLGGLLWLSAIAAAAQTLNASGPPYSGNAPGNEHVFNAPLFVAPNSALEATVPFSYFSWVSGFTFANYAVQNHFFYNVSSTTDFDAIFNRTTTTDLINLAAPTVAITAPSNGATGLTGRVPVTATCTDAVGAASVQIYIDNASFATLTTVRSVTTWDTTKYIDGSHSIYAACTNAGGLTATSSTITASTSNGVSAKTVYLDPTSVTDCPTNNGLSTSTSCKTLAGVQSVVNSLGLHGGDSILQKAGTNLNIVDLIPASVLLLCGPSSKSDNSNGTTYCSRQNVYPGQTISISTYGGSGNCTILSGVTTDCASITLNANGTVPRNFAPLAIFNVPNVAVNNLRLFGSQSNATGCPPAPATTGCAVGIKYAAVNGYRVGLVSNGSVFSNLEIVDFWMGLFPSGYADPGLVNSGVMCNVTVQNSYLHGSFVASPMGYGVESVGAGCPGGGTSLTLTGNYTADQGGAAGISNSTGLYFALAYNVVDNYNALSTVGGNMTGCNSGGAGYGTYWYSSRAVTAIGNESYNNWPPANPSTRCAYDSGGFDMDQGTSLGVLEFSYAHETFGPSVGFFNLAVNNFPMGPNTARYNIFENGGANCGDGTCGMVGMGGGNGGTFISNVIWNGYNGQNVPGYNNSVYGGALVYGYQSCPVEGNTAALVVNNIVVAATNSGLAEMISGGSESIAQNCKTITYKSNDYYPIGGGSAYFRAVLSGQNYTSVTAWNAASGDTGISSNPNFAAPGGGTGATCYGGYGTGIPAAPTCVTNYKLQTGNTMIGAGINLTQSPYNLTLPATDYFGATIPNGVGTGYNLGADGDHH